jgi:nucleoside-diphosphate-sugar epimerase
LGASGISGWALLNQLTRYPDPTAFSRITGLSNRPLTLEQAQLTADPRLNLVNGIDLTKPVSKVAQLLKEKVEDARSITHVFFTAYIQTGDFESLKEVNTNLLKVAVEAVEQVSKKLQTIVLQTGGKGYGLEFPREVGVHPPLREDMPRIPEPYASKIFYYTQYDLLTKLSKGKSWTFSEIRPDGIVGFTPTSNAMNMSQGIGLYLSIFREVHGKGAVVPFPGETHGYQSTHSDTFQDVLAKMEIYAATHIEECGNGGVFNVADGKTVTWAQVWPKLAAHFGLKGEGPQPNTIPMEDFVKDHQEMWKVLVDKYGLKASVVEEQNWGHVHFMLVQFDFDRQYDLSRSRAVGFQEEIDTAEGYFLSWERMRTAKILPPL